MIYDAQSLKIQYQNLANPAEKVSLLSKGGRLTRIKRGLYSDEPELDGPVLANVCCAPSYLSFEYVLSREGIIPEAVSLYTSATFGKKDSKFYQGKGIAFEYRSVPKAVFPYGVETREENGRAFKIACPEKALCDLLYAKDPVRSAHALEEMLFLDLRIDPEALKRMDRELLLQLAPLYRSNTLYCLEKYLKGESA